MDFLSGQQLIDLCKETNLPISQAMKQREIDCGSLDEAEIRKKLETVLTIMRDASTGPLKNPKKSIGGLIGGEAKKVSDFSSHSESICGSMLSRAIAYSMAVLKSMLPWDSSLRHRQLVLPVLFQVFFLLWVKKEPQMSSSLTDF